MPLLPMYYNIITVCAGLSFCDLVSVVMLSTLFPPDPTLIEDNVGSIMEKVELKVKMQVWNDVLAHKTIEIYSGKKFSFKEEECADIYVNCCWFTSWEHLAGSLYHHHQVAAVEEVRSYLPPRGEPQFGIHIIKVFNDYTIVLSIILSLWLHCICISS